MAPVLTVSNFHYLRSPRATVWMVNAPQDHLHQMLSVSLALLHRGRTLKGQKLVEGLQRGLSGLLGPPPLSVPGCLGPTDSRLKSRELAQVNLPYASTSAIQLQGQKANTFC